MNKAVQKDIDGIAVVNAKGSREKNAIFLHLIKKGVNNLCVNFILKNDIHGLILFSKK